MSLFFSLSRLKYKVLYLWIWVASQALVTTVAKLGIRIHSARICVAGPTKHLELVVYSRGNKPPKKREKES